MKTETSRLTILAVSVAGALSLSSGSVAADTIEQLMQNGGKATSDESAEGIWSTLFPWNGTSNGNTLIEVGENLSGFAQWNTLDNADGNNILDGTPNSTMTSVFDAAVYYQGDLSLLSAPPTPGDAGDGVNTSAGSYDFVFEPNAGFATYWENELSLGVGSLAGAMVLFFEDTDVDTPTTSISGALTEIGTGKLLFALGFGADGAANGWGTGATGDERWVALDAPENIAGFNNFNSSFALGSFNSSLSVVYEDPAFNVDFNQISSDLDVLLGTPTQGDGLIDWNLSGQLRGVNDLANKISETTNNPTDSNWVQAYDNTNATFSSVPEPSVLALLASGLFGIGTRMRRRGKA